MMQLREGKGFCQKSQAILFNQALRLQEVQVVWTVRGSFLRFYSLFFRIWESLERKPTGDLQCCCPTTLYYSILSISSGHACQLLKLLHETAKLALNCLI